jgi:hypothetical protein
MWVTRKTGLEVNTEKTKYVAMSRDQNARQNGNIRIGNKSFEMAKGSNIYEQP